MGTPIGSRTIFHTTTFDELTWAVALLIFVRLLRTGDHWLWLALGLAVGIGLDVKFTIAAQPVAMLLALLPTSRRGMLLSPWPWTGAAIALLLLVPKLVWQATHDWISGDDDQDGASTCLLAATPSVSAVPHDRVVSIRQRLDEFVDVRRTRGSGSVLLLGALSPVDPQIDA